MRQIDSNLPPLAHTRMYNWHKFWGRKTWNVVGEYVKNYCPPSGVVLDPFCGSGVTGIEAIRAGRRAVICDLLPIATEIAKLTIQPVNVDRLVQAYERVGNRVKQRILDLYATTCRNCRRTVSFTCAIWNDGECREVRYSCPYCGDTRTKDCALSRSDKTLLKNIESTQVQGWFPNYPLYYADGQPFKEKQRYENLAELFTTRNLQALAWLMAAIEEETESVLTSFLKITFSSMLHLCSRMMPVRPSRPFSSVWSEHSYWYASKFMEQNVWYKFESAVTGRQGIVEAKRESNGVLGNPVITGNPRRVLDGEADICIYTGPAFRLLERLPADSMDYIFTDPPYDASIQYGELGYLATAWLRMDEGYIERVMREEVVRNERQHKDFEVYHSLLSRSFGGMYRVLRPGGRLTVTFHNPTFKVRNATIRAGIFSGFDFEKIHHQELARPSAKSLLQPFGSATGDFYLRFLRPETPAPTTLEEITEERFERIVLETTRQLLAERAEPTPYTLIINYIDPVLAKHGYFSILHTGLDVRTALQNHLGREFELVPGRIGAAEGQLWWLREGPLVARLKQVPLSERVEQTVYRVLRQKGKASFTDVWKAVSEEFPNALTSDSTSILEALEQYGRQVPGGEWMLSPEVGKREGEHADMIALLAELGRSERFGRDIWIAPNEQRQVAAGPYGRRGKLADLVTVRPVAFAEVANKEDLMRMDLLWFHQGAVVAAFEVEYTTAMTGALIRGSNLRPEVPKYLVIPEEREGQFKRKLRSPMFADRFAKDNWGVLYFDLLTESYRRLKKGDLSIEQVEGRTRERRRDRRDNPGQLKLYPEEAR